MVERGHQMSPDKDDRGIGEMLRFEEMKRIARFPDNDGD